MVVVKHFDAIHYIGSGFIFCIVNRIYYPFYLQRVKEALGNSIRPSDIGNHGRKNFNPYHRMH